MTGGKAGSYVAGAMFTADYVEKAARLAASCEKFGLGLVARIGRWRREVDGIGGRPRS
jgi:hypothetical protein